MDAALVPERDWRGPGCDHRCQVIEALVPGVFGRSELLLHDADAHEEYGRWQASPSAWVGRHTVITGPLSVNLSSLAVAVDGQPVCLTRTELRILCVLARRVGEAASYEELLELLWGPGDRGERHLLRVNIARLRAKLGPARSLIVTLLGSAYRLDSLAPGLSAPRPATTLYAPSGRWARHWTACRGCGSTTSRHRARGFCCRGACRTASREPASYEPS